MLLTKTPLSSLLRQHLPHRDSHQLNQPNYWDVRAGKTAAWGSPVPACGLQPARESGEHATEFDPIHPTVSARCEWY